MMDLYSQAERELKRRVAEKASENRRRLAGLAELDPEFAAVEEELRQAGLEAVRAGLRGFAPGEKLDALEERRAAILARHGLSDIAEGGHYCPICGDRGYISDEKGERRCRCFTEIYSELLALNDTAWDHSARLSDFRTDVYPEDAHMDRFLKNCARFVREFPSAENKDMLFIGKTGLGKTFMCSCLMNEIVALGIPAMYLKASEMFYGVSQLGDRELRDRICSIPFLVIDDLGSEKQSDTRYADLLDILDSRASLHRVKGYSTVISTNLTPKEMISFYDERISSRLLGEYDIFRFTGNDLRLTSV